MKKTIAIMTLMLLFLTSLQAKEYTRTWVHESKQVAKDTALRHAHELCDYKNMQIFIRSNYCKREHGQHKCYIHFYCH